MNQFVDPAVSRRKFDRELSNFRAAERYHASRGWWLMWAEFPLMQWGFVASKTTPPFVAFGVSLDFTNYDVWAPSVSLVHPFTGIAYKAGELAVPFFRRVPSDKDEPSYVSLVQVHEGQMPFVCLPGVREYHEHPAHTGDHWFLIRNTPSGSLSAVLEPLYTYGSSPLTAVNYEVQLKFAGFQQRQPEA